MEKNDRVPILNIFIIIHQIFISIYTALFTSIRTIKNAKLQMKIKSNSENLQSLVKNRPETPNCVPPKRSFARLPGRRPDTLAVFSRPL